MTDIRQTTTNYIHPTDPNLLNIHKAMKFNADGEPVVRTHVDGITLEGNVIVDTVSLSSSTLAALESINVQNIVGITGTVTVSNFTSTVHVDNFPTTSTVYQGTNPWVVTGNVNVTTTQTDLTVADSNYYMNLARGLIPGQYVFTRSALNPDVSQNVETSIWVEGGTYPHGTWTTAQRLYVASDNAADTGQTIFIEGLNSNYDYTTATIVTNGTTAVATAVSETFIRIYTATIISASNNAANAGEIRFRIGSAAGTVVAHIRAGFGITKLSQYTVPRGYTAYVVYGDATTFRGGSGNIGSQIKMMVRPFGGSFVVAFIAEVVNGYYRNDFTVPMRITEKSDIDVRVIADANNTIASCNYQMILIPN